MGHNFRFMTRFGISTSELFVIMNSFTVAERNKDQWIYQWICDIQIILEVMLCKFAKDDCLNTELC